MIKFKKIILFKNNLNFSVRIQAIIYKTNVDALNISVYFLPDNHVIVMDHIGIIWFYNNYFILIEDEQCKQMWVFCSHN